MNKSINNIGMFIQVVLASAIIIMMIISIFTDILLIPLQILIIPELCVMAYNNQKIYKKKFMTFIYLAFAIFIAATLIIGAL